MNQTAWFTDEMLQRIERGDLPTMTRRDHVITVQSASGRVVYRLTGKYSTSLDAWHAEGA